MAASLLEWHMNIVADLSHFQFYLRALGVLRGEKSQLGHERREWAARSPPRTPLDYRCAFFRKPSNISRPKSPTCAIKIIGIPAVRTFCDCLWFFWLGLCHVLIFG